MADLRRGIHRAVWLAGVCLAVAAPRASANPSIVADFDGDGRRDRAMVEQRTPSVLRVWLSTTQESSKLYAKSPILAMAAGDLDGDRRDELIAADSSGLQIWTTFSGEFKPVHPPQAPPGALTRTVRHTVGEGSDDAPVGVAAAGPPPVAPAFTIHPIPPQVSSGLWHHGTSAAGSTRLLTPFAPRPPPLAL
jgi:hypothetical protein